MTKDLTVGKPSTVLFKFCLPMFASIIFQQLYNLADSFVAGKFINNEALAAVGNSYELTLIYLAFAFGCNIGGSVIISKYFGANRLKDVKTAISTSFLFSFTICAILVLLSLIFTDNLLELIKTPDNIFADSKLYLDIYIYGLPFVFLYNISTGIFTALGDSTTPFIFLACSSIANIFLDILFVAKYNMGVGGVAWATFICQGVSCTLALLTVLIRTKSIKTEAKAPLFSTSILKDIVVIAVPSIMQQSFVSVGNIIIQSVINSFGSALVAGYAASIKLNNLLITTLTTIGNGISNFTAQNLGAGKPDRIKEGFTAGLKLVWFICVPFFLLYFFFGKNLLFIFLESKTGYAMENGILFLRIISPFYLIISGKIVSDGILRGCSKIKMFTTGTFVDLILRTGLVIILSKTALQATGIWLSWPIGWTIATFLSLYFYRRCKKTDFK